MENIYLDKIARILRVDKHVLYNLDAEMAKITGKVDVIKNIALENERLVKDRMQQLGLPQESSASAVYDALISKIEADDLNLFKVIGISTARSLEAAQKICAFVKKFVPMQNGYFLKLEKAKELLIAEPPRFILSALGYNTVEDMLVKEDIFEVYSALRFLEGSEWLNNVFFKQYEKLRPEDFEERAVEIRAISPKWTEAAQKFVAKKHHNVSHLKELGVIFVIPIFLGISGETMRLMSLLVHYVHEVAYYSTLFKRCATGPIERFASSIVSLLRGDVVEDRLALPMSLADRPRWMIVQRYLAKDDENDWRLFEPHINPEAVHWEKAVDDIVGIETVIPNFSAEGTRLPDGQGSSKGGKDGLSFWQDIGWVGDYFLTETGVQVLVSFNLVDTAMSLVKQKELVKYLYHQEEALWNKIFLGYFSQAEMERFLKDYAIQGWFEV